MPLDVTNPKQIIPTVEESTKLTNIDVVFSNAGYGLIGALEACTDEQITAQINIGIKTVAPGRHQK